VRTFTNATGGTQVGGGAATPYAGNPRRKKYDGCLNEATGVLLDLIGKSQDREMSKKKAAAKKKTAGPSRPASPPKSKRAGRTGQRTIDRPKVLSPAGNIYVYRHEVESNPSNAPLIVEIPIAAGRGEHPTRPSFVGFTAEMAEEHWPDQFAFRIIALDNANVRVMISRVDKGSNDMGWGARLVVQVLVVADTA
jgi:hypothetical protein